MWVYANHMKSIFPINHSFYTTKTSSMRELETLDSWSEYHEKQKAQVLFIHRCELITGRQTDAASTQKSWLIMISFIQSINNNYNC